MTRPDSPCKGVCTTLYTTFCAGCGRHYLEVCNWVFLSDEEKEAIRERVKREEEQGVVWK